MINNVVTDALMDAGMKCLVEKLGIVEAEMFIAIIREDTFDYTEWRQDNLWQDLSLDEVLNLAVEKKKKK
jgi:hypothetical protein